MFFLRIVAFIAILPFAFAVMSFGLGIRVANTMLAVPLEPRTGMYALENAFGDMAVGTSWRGWPVAITAPLGETNRLFIASQSTGISVITNLASPTMTLFLDIRERVSFGGESGVLGLVFHPGFATNRFFYVFYTAMVPQGNGILSDNRLSRFTASPTNPDQALPDSEQILFFQPARGGNHYGGDLHFGPDGYLYLAMGDGIYRTNSQRIDQDFFGAVLRIDVDKRPGSLEPNPHPNVPTNLQGKAPYSVPSDNPFVGAASFNGEPVDPAKVRTEFWAVGFRNPWRMSFDTLTGDLYCGDVGAGTAEEINRVVKGGNYGWPFLEGNKVIEAPPPGFQSIVPILTIPWGNEDYQARSVIGGVVYRGSQLPELSGSYVFGNFTGGQVWKLISDGTNEVPFELITTGVQPSVFGIDPRNGDVLVAAYQESKIKRLVRGSGAGNGSIPAVLSASGAFSDLATLTPEAGIVQYDVNVPFWSDHAIKSRWFSIPNPNQRMTFSANANWSFPTGTVWIKHFELELTNGVPESARRLETRFFVKNQDGGHGFTYRWNSTQTDAVLVEAGGQDETIPIYRSDGSLLRNQTWRYPSRSECMQCHTPQGGYALGFNSAQLNRAHDSGGSPANQISELGRLGYFDGPVPDSAALPRLAQADDTSASVEHRARSYLQANCVQCHQPGGVASGKWDARLSTPLAEAGLIDGSLLNNYEDEANRVIRPGSLEHSMLFRRISRMGPGHMPPLATSEVNEGAVSLLSQWITNSVNSVVFSVDADGYVYMVFAGVAGRTYRVEATSDLVTWETVGTVRAPESGLVKYLEPVDERRSARFYRVAWP